MSFFAIKYPFFILMMCLFVIVVGTTTVTRMPVDLFPEVNIPVVVVATFYSGMPPEQIESDITDSYERFFTLGSGIDHIESRSLTGVSIIKIYFQPGTDANAAVSNISNLAMANLRRLPPGTLPPVDSNDDGFQTNPTPFTWQSQHDSIAIGRRCQRYRYANGSRPLSIAPRIRYLRYAKEGGPQPSQQRGGEDR
jgi:multidrug efflux pump subunit AcrB